MTWLTDNLVLYKEFIGLLALPEREGLRKMGLAPCEVWVMYLLARLVIVGLPLVMVPWHYYYSPVTVRWA